MLFVSGGISVETERIHSEIGIGKSSVSFLHGIRYLSILSLTKLNIEMLI